MTPEVVKAKRVRKPPYIGLVEIARSYSFKLNLGNYQSADFFCSQKAQCNVKDADSVSQALYAFCKASVMNAVAQAREEQRALLSAAQEGGRANAH